MFKSFDEDCAVLPERNSQSYHLDNRMIGHETRSRKEDMESQKILLPRGSAQTKCGPQPYFYFASNSGAMPSWMIDDITRRNHRRAPAD